MPTRITLTFSAVAALIAPSTSGLGARSPPMASTAMVVILSRSPQPPAILPRPRPLHGLCIYRNAGIPGGAASAHGNWDTAPGPCGAANHGCGAPRSAVWNVVVLDWASLLRLL